MNKKEFETNIKRLDRWNLMHKESEKQFDELCPEVISEMIALGIDHICLDDCTASLTKITEKEFDVEAFRQAMPDVYAAFIRETTRYELKFE